MLCHTLGFCWLCGWGKGWCRSFDLVHTEVFKVREGKVVKSLCPIQKVHQGEFHRQVDSCQSNCGLSVLLARKRARLSDTSLWNASLYLRFRCELYNFKSTHQQEHESVTRLFPYCILLKIKTEGRFARYFNMFVVLLLNQKISFTSFRLLETFFSNSFFDHKLNDHHIILVSKLYHLLPLFSVVMSKFSLSGHPSWSQ